MFVRFVASATARVSAPKAGAHSITGGQVPMRRALALCFCTLLIAASQAAGRGEYHLGGADGTPWQDALSTEAAGAYLVFDSSGQQSRRVPVGVTPHGAGVESLIDYSGSSIQPRFIDPSVNMALSDPDAAKTKIPLLYTGGQGSTSDGCGATGQHVAIVRKMFDGDVTTAHFRRFTPGQSVFTAGGQVIAGVTGTGQGWRSASILDFGGAVPVNRIRFFPRLGREDDALLIEELSQPIPPIEEFGEDSFVDNFLAWYEIRTADNSVRIADGPCDRVSGRNWVGTADPRLKVFRDTRENLDPVVDLRFPTQSIRWITIRPFPLRNWEIAEFEVYGEGFVEETVFVTQILDFDRTINWGKIRWSGQMPEGTRVEIRTRTGATPDPSLYFAENINGDIRQITLEQFQKIDPTGRMPTVYDADNWSFWSPPYEFAAGLRDQSLDAEAWEDGTPLLSPGPSRYIQIAIRLFGNFATAPRLDQLSLQFGEAPSAQEVLGEIWPIQVESFRPTTFTYVVKPRFDQSDTGFDRLEVLTHVRADSVDSVLIDGREVDLDLFGPEVQDDRVVFAFPRLQGEDDSFKQLEVSFQVPVLRFGTKFSGWVFDSEDPDQIKQQIQPGNATFRFAGDVLAVNTPVGGDLLVDVVVSPNPFTPNGDGVNDALSFSYQLREVTAARPISLVIYDLAGAAVAEFPTVDARSGEFTQRWDGSDAAGRLVPPGMYLYRLRLDASLEDIRTGVLSVIY